MLPLTLQVLQNTAFLSQKYIYSLLFLYWKIIPFPPSDDVQYDLGAREAITIIIFFFLLVGSMYIHCT